MKNNFNENKQFYDIEELLQNTNKFKSIILQYKIFRTFYKDYFNRTPESDSLYRRRNRLIILIAGCGFYYKTSYNIFNRTELKIFSMAKGKGLNLKKLLIPLGKSVYFLTCIFMSQLFMKYIYYLNKVYKSYQFALEGVLKYNIMKKNYVYQGDNEFTGRFDILDSENIKKNQ